MGFPVSYKDLSLPKLIDYTFSYLSLMKELLFVMLFYYPGSEAFLDPDIPWPTRPKTRNCMPALVLTRELMPVVKYSQIVDPPESCAVCLYEFSDSEEIRRLTNCRHIFHRKCVDSWMDHEHRTCPLCRTPFISEDMQEAFNERLWTASGISDF
ncbi:brassinosteroid-responsive RING protein 1-like [Apium graveolens]|uniref:brassinosteroid-responsive RING protein 1-like n=1 Tax=Apium graveolens TaxID=4045 RepID=UPI003D7B5EAD